MSETENIPTERNGKVYFSNGFFRSTETDGYIGLLFIGTENEYQ